MSNVIRVDNASGVIRWMLVGTSLCHREDGPALIEPGLYEAWCRLGKYHRHDGPAILYNSGKVLWFLNGQQINSTKVFQLLSKLSDEDMAILILKYGDIT